MKKIILIILVLASSAAFAQTPPDSINHIVDSLFVRASSGMVMYRDLVEPATKALGAMGEPAVPRLVEKMKTQDAREMQTFESVFKIIGHPAVPLLVEALGSVDPYRRRLSARVLGEMKDSSAVNGLIEYVEDRDFRMRAGVISALGKINDKRGVAPSLAALKDDDYLVRTSAAISLTYLADSTTVTPLIEALSDPYYGVRYSAVEALTKIGSPAVTPIADGLAEPNDETSFYLIIEAAGNLKNEKLADPLIKILSSDDYNARAFAVEALGKIGGKDVMKALQKQASLENHPFVLSKLKAIKFN